MYLLNERLWHLGILREGDRKIRHHVAEHRAVQVKPRSTVSFAVQMSDVEKDISTCLSILNTGRQSLT